MNGLIAGDAGRQTEGRWLRALRHNWPHAVCRLLEGRDSVVVRVLIAEVRGSAPREPGACMLVSPSGIQGTIGGGNLEWQALRAAQPLLTGEPAPSVRLRRLVLGRELGQCCGGVVQLWLERFTHADLPLLRRTASAILAGRGALIATELSARGVVRKLLAHRTGQWAGTDTGRGAHSKPGEGTVTGPGSGVQPRVQFSSAGAERASLLERIEQDTAKLWLYGAGHVGQALIRLAAELPFEVTWVDSREELLPAPLPDNVHALCSRTPTDTVLTAPAATRFLVMTHDHALDYALCRKILERGEFAWLGLIGSKSKGARFRSRLARDGVALERIARLICPIGIEGVISKWPAAIAVGVAAQLLQGLETPAAEPRRSSAPMAEVFGGGCSSPDCAACSTASP